MSSPIDKEQQQRESGSSPISYGTALRVNVDSPPSASSRTSRTFSDIRANFDALSWSPNSRGSPPTARPLHPLDLPDPVEEDDSFYTAPPPHSPCSEASSSSFTSSCPPPFSSLVFPSASNHPRPEQTTFEPGSASPPDFAPLPSDAGPLEPEPSSALAAETKSSFSRDPKGEQSADEEPPPPYTEGDSPIDSFTYVMAAAGGASSIITQVQQTGGPPINTLGGMRIRPTTAVVEYLLLIVWYYRRRR